MNNNTDNTSDIKKAADNVDAGQIEDNLQHSKQVDAPEDLSEDQKTPFIDEDARTDK